MSKSFIDVKKNIQLEQTDISYKIKSKEIKKILKIDKGEIYGMNLYEGRSPYEEAEGKSADNDVWEILVRIKSADKTGETK